MYYSSSVEAKTLRNTNTFGSSGRACECVMRVFLVKRQRASTTCFTVIFCALSLYWSMENARREWENHPMVG